MKVYNLMQETQASENAGNSKIYTQVYTCMYVCIYSRFYPKSCVVSSEES